MSAPVEFAAQLLALGEAGGIDLQDYDGQVVLVFVVDVQNARKAATLFGLTARLHAGPLHDAAEDLLTALRRAEHVLGQRHSEGLREEVRTAIEKAEGRR